MRDRRTTPARADLAAAHLKGEVEASRFVEGMTYCVIAPSAPLRRDPGHDALLDTEALHGERVTVYETTDEGLAWGQLASDGYVGWLPASMLARPMHDVTHKVCALRTLAFPGPSIKLSPVATLSMNCQVVAERDDGSFAITREGWHLPLQHVASIHDLAEDFVAVAEAFAGTPYLWGGKTSLGIDCSGLVQIALAACGVAAPRDSDMQEQAFGEPVALDAELRRGDLIFWKGHVAVARNADSLVHANAHHMAVAVEPIRDAVARIAATGSAITTIRRRRII